MSPVAHSISPGETLEPRRARRLGAGGELGFDIGCETVSKDRKDYPKRGGESLPDGAVPAQHTSPARIPYAE